MSTAYSSPANIADAADLTQALAPMGADPRRDQRGPWWSARCIHPQHADDTPSMRYRDGDQALIITCFGCAPTPAGKARWFADVLDAAREGRPLPPAAPSSRRTGGSRGGIRVCEYVYTAADGQPVARKVRWADPKTFTWERPYGDTWISGLGAGGDVAHLPLYRLPEVVDAPEVWLCEGEKDTEAAAELGLAATCPAAGSGGLPRDFSILTGKTINIVLDRDDAGRRHALRCHDALQGVAAHVRIWAPLPDHEHADLSDHLAAGHTIDQLQKVRAFGGRLHQEESPMHAHPGGDNTMADDRAGRRRITLTSAADIRPRPTRWLWAGRFALGAISLIAGPEGTGKSTLAYTLAAEVTRGTLAGDRKGQPKAVLVVATEDSWEHTIVPRLMAAGADLARVYRVEVMTSEDTHGSLNLPHDNAELEGAIGQTDAAMVLLDPLMSRLAGLDTHKDGEVRLALEPIAAIADRTSVSVVGLIHFNKSGSGDVLNNVMASKAFTAVARSVSMVVRDADDESGRARIFATPKNNLGRDDLPMLRFTIAGHAIDTEEGPAHTSQLVWGGTVDGSIGEHIGASTDPEARSMAAEAREWLTQYMHTEGGRVLATDASKAYSAFCGDRTDNARRRLSAARRRLGYDKESKGYPAVHYWIDRASADKSPGESSELSALSEQGASADSADSAGVTPREVSALDAELPWAEVAS